MSKKSPKYRDYGEGFTEEVLWNARVFLCLQGSCLKSHLQDMLEKMIPNVTGRLDGRDADKLLKQLHANGLIKFVEYNSKNKESPKICALTDDQLKSGDITQLLEGIFRYWHRNIHDRKQKKGKFDREHDEFISTHKWCGQDFIKKWANFVEDDMTQDMKDNFKANVSGRTSIPELYKTAETKVKEMN